MLLIVLISAGIIAVAMLFFSATKICNDGQDSAILHIDESEEMRRRGINCAIEQDKEARQKSRSVVSEH